MARYLRGDIVLMPFPFSGESAYKHRPALVLASWSYGNSTDYLTCLITTQRASDPYLMEIVRSDTDGQSLQQACYLRPTYLFTTGEVLISRRLDRLKAAKVQDAIQRVVTALTA